MSNSTIDTGAPPQQATEDHHHYLRPHYQPGIPAAIEVPDAPLSELLETAARFYPDRVAIDFLGATMTYQELLEASERAAQVLRASGVRKGDRVALIMPNCPQHAIALYGALRIGALTLRLDPEAPRGYEVVTVRTFDPAHAIDALLGAVPDGIVAVERADGAFCVSATFPPGELIEDYRVVPVEELRSQEVTRVVLRAPGMPLDRFTALVRECGLHSVEYAIGWTAWLDVAPPGVTKASALDDLVVRLGTGPQRAIAVGDGSNDTEMLVWAGVGVAMGSAPQWVRDLADVTTEPVWRDGAAAVLDAVVERVRKQ